MRTAHVTIKPDLTCPIPAELGAVHFVGIGGSGMSGIARLFLDAGHRVTGSDRARHREHRATSRDLGADGRHRPRRRERRRRRHLVVHRRALAGQPRVPARARARAAGAAPLAGARLAHRRPAPRLGRRRARQDHLDRHDRHRRCSSSARTRASSTAASSQALGVERGTGSRRAVRRRGRRVRRLVPALRHRRSRSSRTSTPTTSTTTASHDAFERRVRRRSRPRRASSSSSPPTTPGAARVAARLDAPSASSPSARPTDADVRVTRHRHRRARVVHARPTRARRTARRSRVPGRHNAINAAGAFAVLVGLGLRPASRPSRGIERLRRHRAPVRAARHRARRERLRRLRAPPDRGRGGARGGAHRRRRRPDHRGAPAALYSRTQAMSPGSSPRCYEQLRRPHGRARRLRRARGPGARRDRGARRRARSPTRRTSHYVPDWQEAADYTAPRSPATATSS